MQTSRLINMPLSEVMVRWPQTIRVFIDSRIHCVGCPIAPFHTVVDAAAEHGLNLGDLTGELEVRASRDEGRRPA